MSSYGIEFIKLCQKNRYPLLFIDEISDLVPGVSVKAKKNFTYNEWFFPSHFEGNPNVPGFVQLESLTQAFIMTFLTKDEFRGKETAFIAIENAKFRRKIIPGETLIISAVLESLKFGIAIGRAEGSVDGEATCSVKLTIAIPEEITKFTPRSKS